MSKEQALQKRAPPEDETRRMVTFLLCLPILEGLGWAKIGVHDILAEKPSPHIDGPVLRKGVEIRAAVMEHDSLWEDILGEAISKATAVIPEYFPPEYADAEQAAIFGSLLKDFRRHNKLFGNVAAWCHAAEKNVWVLDPAFGFDFVKTQAIICLPDILAVMAPLSYQALKTKPNSLHESHFSRRAFFQRLGKPAAGATLSALFVLGGGNAPAGWWGANTLRQLLVADHIARLIDSGKFQAGDSLLAIYPAGHWYGLGPCQGIKGYLQNDELRARDLSIAMQLFKGLFPEMFGVRNYPTGKFSSKRSLDLGV